MYDIVGSVVVFKNNEKLLKKTIESFLKTSLKVKLLLIDNSPTPYFGKFQLLDKRIRYFFNGKNLGFGKAHNLGLKLYHNRCKYHLVLNPDVSFEESTLEFIFRFMENNKNFGLLMPKVKDSQGKIQFLCKNNPQLSTLILRRFLPKALKPFFSKKMEKFENKNLNYNEFIYDIPFLSGCFMFLRSEILAHTGFFDPRFFLYMEDADLTRRILSVANTVYYPHVSIRHHHQRSSYRHIKYTLIHSWSAIFYFIKWFGVKNQNANQQARLYSDQKYIFCREFSHY